jgi:hypothetical protein
VAEPVQRRADRLALWIEDRRFEGNENAGFHLENSIIAR